MGFRCPFCKADFGHDKTGFEKHMKEEKDTPSIEALATTNLTDTLKNAMEPLEYMLKNALNPEDNKNGTIQ